MRRTAYTLADNGEAGPEAGSDDTDGSSGSLNLSDHAYERLLDLMLSGKLPGGTPLQERRLAVQLGISRTPMRAAFARLESEGLIERQLNRFLIVRQLTVQEFIEILNVRQLLETEATGLAAARAAGEEIAKARAMVIQLMNADSPTVAEHWATDDAVHNLIAQRCGNAVLAAMIRELRHRTHMFDVKRIPNRLQDSCTEHLALLDALEAHDVKRAQQVIRLHIENVKKSIIKKLTNL